MKKRSFALLLALVLVLGGAIGASLAWLTDKTDPVVNTFTTSGIKITLTETTGADYKMVPGLTLEKDPTVTVKAGSEKCFVFVKVDKSDNFDTFLLALVDDNNWEQGNGTDVPANVYFTTVDAASGDVALPVFKDDQVWVRNTVTQEMMDALTQNSYPKVTFTAYACQYMNGDAPFTAAEAWAVIGN